MTNEKRERPIPGDHSPDAVKTVRLMVSPEDSTELLGALYHACNFALQGAAEWG